MSKHGVIKLNGKSKVVRSNKSSENCVPSKVGFVGELIEGEKSVMVGTEVDVSIDEV
jgi:hypothetical protein